MGASVPGPARIARWILASLALTLASTGSLSALAATLTVLVDADNNAATGCSVATPNGAFGGVEQRFVTTVDTAQNPPRVTGVTAESCTAAPGAFSAPVVVSGGGWAVGLGNGTGGSNVIETGLPTGVVGPVRIGLVYADAGIGQDAVTTAPGGGPIVVAAQTFPGPLEQVPTLSDAMLALLVALMLAVGWKFGRHRFPAAPLAVVALVTVTTIAWAAIVLDGLIGDWAGMPPVATDGVDTDGADISTVFATIEGTTLFVRVDARTGRPPTAVADTYTAVSGAPLAIVPPSGLLDNDDRGIPAATVASFGGGSLGGNVTSNVAGATATFGVGGSLTVNSAGGFTYTPAAGFTGAFTFSYRISSVNGTSDATVTINTQQAPAITSANATAFNVGTAGSFTVTATGFPAPTLSMSGALPAGVSFNAATGVLSGTAAAGTAGTYPLVFTAANGVAPNATQNFTLTVNQTVAITSANATTFTVGTAGSFTITTSATPTATNISIAGALPTGVSLGATSGTGTAVLSGTPAAGTGGTYTVTITASNGGVTPNGTQSFTLTVNEAPAITSANAATFLVGTPGTHTVVATGFPAPTRSVTGALPNGVTFNAATGVLSGTPAAGTAGAYPLTFTAANGVGTDATQSFTLTVQDGVQITSANAVTFTVGTVGNFTVTTAGTPSATSVTATGALPTGVNFTDNGATGLLAGNPAALSGGVYNLTINATNGVPPNASQAFTLTVNEAPAITSANATTFTVGQAGSFSVTSTGFPARTYSVTGALPSGVTLAANGTLSGTPAAGTGGTYSVTITASNGVGTDATQPFTLTVNQAPTITSANATTFTVGALGSFTATATGVPAPTLSFAGPAVGGVTAVGAVLSGTPAAGTGGTYNFTVSATNGVLPNASQPFTLTVNEAPTITSANNASFQVGVAGSFTVTASGFPGSTFTTGGPLPSGVTLAANGTLSGTPNPGTGGVYPFLVTASNGVAPNATQSFTLTVTDPPVAVDDPLLTTVHDTALAVGAPGVLGNDNVGVPPGAVASFGGGSLGGTVVTNAAGAAVPFGTSGSLTVNADGSIAFTPDVETAGAFTFLYRVTNTDGSSDATVTITVTNQAPVVDLNGAAAGIDSAATFNEGGGAVAIVDAALAVTDADDANLTGATIEITNLLDGVSEALALTCPDAGPGCSGAILLADLTVTATALANRIEIAANAPLADYQALLRTLTYNNTSANPSGTPRDVTVTINDGIADNNPVAHAIVTIAGVNQAPTITAPATAATPVDTALAFAGTVSVADPDAGTNDVQVTLTATNGTVTLSGTAGLTVSGNGTALVTSTGPIASQNAALNGMSFTPGSGFASPPDATLKIDVSDLGNTGSGGALTDTHTVNITVDNRPSVTSTVPANAATAVGTASTITVNFNESVTFTGASFTVSCSVSGARPFTLSASPSASVVITPNTALPPGESCTVTVVAAQVTDSIAQTMAADHVFSFTVNTLPTVTSTTPANGAPAVTLASDITLNFSEAVNATGTAATISCTTSGAHAFALSGSGTATVTLDPTVDFTAGEACTVTVVAAQVTDVDGGQNMAADYPFSFTVATPPTITSVNSATFTVGSLGTHTVTTTGNPTVTNISMASVTPGPGGVLPAGVSFSYTSGANGALSGTPTNAAQVGTYVVSFTATNGIPSDAVQNPFTLTVQCPAITLAPANNSTFTASYNQLFTQAFSPSGGTAPYSYALSGAALPSVAFSGNNLTGTPNNTGSFAFTVQATDANGCTSATQSYTLNVNPVAANDAYNALGNVQVVSANGSPAAFSVADNDAFPAGTTISAFDAASANGGAVAMTTAAGATLGQFTYDPPVGYTGSDSFTYTLSSNGRTATGTVTFTVSGIVWFVSNAVGACPGAPCDGRMTHPFTDTAGFQAVNGTGTAPNPQNNHAVFVYGTGTNYTGAATLRNGQRLVGQGATSTLASLAGVTAQNGQSLPATGGSAPVLGGALTVGQNNFIHGVTLSGSTALTGTTFGTLTINENVAISTTGQAISLNSGTLAATFTGVTSSGGTNNIALTGVTTSGTAALGSGALSGASSNALAVSGQNGSFSYGGTISNTTALAVSIQNKTGGTVALSGAINPSAAARGILVQNNSVGTNTITFSGTPIRISSGTNAGVTLATNTGATITFSGGGLDIAATSGAGFTATGGAAAVNVTGTGNVISTTTGTALNVVSTTIGGSDLVFEKISANGATNGIVLNTTGSLGGLVVTGNGGSCTLATPTCTGGDIRNTTGDAVLLTSTENVTLTRMRVRDNAGSGIRGVSVNGFVLDSMLIDDNGDSAATDDSGIDIIGLFGTASGGTHPTSITNSTIRNNFEFEIQITNPGSSALADLTMSGNAISADGLQPNHGNLMNFLSLGTGAMKLSITSGSFTGNTDTSGGKIVTATGVQCDHSGTGGLMTCNISGATFTNNNVGPQASVAQSGQVLLDFNGNTITGTRSHGINLFADANSPFTKTLSGRIRNNVIGTDGVANSGSQLGPGIRVQNEGSVPVTLVIENNTIQETQSFQGINVNVGISIGSALGGAATNLTILNNSFNDIGSRAIVVQDNDASTGTKPTVCVDMSSNFFGSGIAGQAGDGSWVRLRELSGTFNVRQATPTTGVNAAELDDQQVNGNDASGTKYAIGGTPQFSQPACAQPSN